jgi:hypothetical protein
MIPTGRPSPSAVPTVTTRPDQPRTDGLRGAEERAQPGRSAADAERHRCIADLTFLEAEQLLDWLETRGITGRVVLQPTGNCTVHWDEIASE